MRDVKIPIEGMHCAACATSIENTLQSLSGILQAKVNFTSESAIVTYDESKVKVRGIVAQIKRTGYDVKKESSLAYIWYALCRLRPSS